MIDLNDDVDWPVNKPGRFHHRRMVPLPGTKNKYDYINKMTKSEKDELLNKYFGEISKQKIPQSAVSNLPSKASKAGRVAKFLKRGGRAGLIAGLGAAAYEAYGYFKQKRQSRGEK